MFKDNFEILPGTGFATLVTAAPALYAAGSAINAKIKYGQEVDKIESLLDERQDITNPYKDLENPYKNLPVATQAARFQAENADIALANTLDTLRATGASAGGATALAQAALQSQQGISASLEKQEAQNARLRAQGQLQVDMAKAKGESFRMRMQEARDVRDVNRMQRQADIFKATQIANERAAFDQLGAAAEQFTSGIVPAKLDSLPGSGADADAGPKFTTSGPDFDPIDPATQTPASMQNSPLMKDPDLKLSRAAASKAYQLDPSNYQANIDRMVKDPSFGLLPDGTFTDQGEHLNPFYGLDLGITPVGGQRVVTTPFGRTGVDYTFLNDPTRF